MMDAQIGSATGGARGGARGSAPAMCERGPSREEAEFLAAIRDYRRSSGRNFPTWSEVLEVAQGLGYRKAGV